MSNSAEDTLTALKLVLNCVSITQIIPPYKGRKYRPRSHISRQEIYEAVLGAQFIAGLTDRSYPKEWLENGMSMGTGNGPCTGCIHLGKYNDELEYGAACPCLRCKRSNPDNFTPEK